MADHDSDLGAFMAGFLLGGMIGAGVALLLAPQTGEETREMLRERSIELKSRAEQAASDIRTKAESRLQDLLSLLAIIGLINVPIIKYSVEWWNTLHQPATISKMGKPSMDTDMLIWLLVMLAGFMCLFGALLLVRARAEVIQRSRGQKWLRAALEEG